MGMVDPRVGSGRVGSGRIENSRNLFFVRWIFFLKIISESRNHFFRNCFCFYEKTCLILFCCSICMHVLLVCVMFTILYSFEYKFNNIKDVNTVV